MGISEAQNIANMKYQAKTYAPIRFLPKKSEAATIKEYAAERNESITRFIVRSCMEQMERDGGSAVDMPQAGGGNAHREAWGDFFTAIDASNEDVPDFERVSFTREVEL